MKIDLEKDDITLLEAIENLKQEIQEYATDHSLNPETIRQELNNGRTETWEDCMLLQRMNLLEMLTAQIPGNPKFQSK